MSDERGTAKTGCGDLVVAVDCSTTASKAVVFDAHGHALSSGRRAFATSQPSPGRHEQDPQDWWSATHAALRESLSAIDPTRIAAVCVTTQRETFVCLGDDNEPVMPGIVWMDTRARDLVEELGTDVVHAMSGRPADNTPSMYKIAWLMRNEPDIMARVAKLGDVSAYLNMRLTGSWVTSHASADSTGLLDMSTLHWSETLAATVGIDSAVFPGVVPPGALIGVVSDEAAALTGLARGTPVIAGAGDGQCAALGAGLVDSTSVYLNMGTAIVCGRPSVDYNWGRAYRTVAAAYGNTYLFEAFTASGTYLINWFRENFEPKFHGTVDSAESDTELCAERIPPGSEALLALPYWNAAQTPHWDPKARGALIGLTGRHGRAHIYRAILEGIAFEIKLEMTGLDSETEPIQQVFVTGGGSRSPLWMQIVADITGRPLTMCAEQETTALGAAMVAVVAVGLHPTMEAATKAMTHHDRKVFPNPETTARYDELWPIYRGLYDSLRPSLHALNAFA
ncbi:MAG: FGGY family carbohydrate kinase [Rhodococcus sp. (in: high G+C Gram-positive bacteria)]|uniref:xylulokinase n=1 Tax=Rhodococcus sp. TaxID=1831 RepID=UPI002AD9D657|nr:FGGY family carbohydrate kinase [Rhodococcus sp. (in: high G+C Gram-positive bacteria)]